MADRRPRRTPGLSTPDDRRWCEAWVSPGGDVVEGAALLNEFEVWDGDDTGLAPDRLAQLVDVDRRIAAYEDWCAAHGVTPARRPAPGPAHWWGE